LILAVIASLVASTAGAAAPADTISAAKPLITARDVAAAERIVGLDFSEAERDSLLRDIAENLESYLAMRGIALDNAVAPAIEFNPLPAGFPLPSGRSRFEPSPARKLVRPADLEELAFLPVRDLAELIRTKKVSSIELTRMYLGRLRRLGPRLECVVTLTEERALEAARRADEEIAGGRYRGLLHGIPYGAKDLLAVKGYPTTWGAAPYKDQTIDADASVIRKLDQAGAVLVAKLTLGALAWGDVWFGGTTRNPWNLEQGSSGSSAGSAAATAGLNRRWVSVITSQEKKKPKAEMPATNRKAPWGET
jgi:hypothetical protein